MFNFAGLLEFVFTLLQMKWCNAKFIWKHRLVLGIVSL